MIRGMARKQQQRGRPSSEADAQREQEQRQQQQQKLAALDPTGSRRLVYGPREYITDIGASPEFPSNSLLEEQTLRGYLAGYQLHWAADGGAFAFATALRVSQISLFVGAKGANLQRLCNSRALWDTEQRKPVLFLVKAGHMSTDAMLYVLVPQQWKHGDPDVERILQNVKRAVLTRLEELGDATCAPGYKPEVEQVAEPAPLGAGGTNPSGPGDRSGVCLGQEFTPFKSC